MTRSDMDALTVRTWDAYARLLSRYHRDLGWSQRRAKDYLLAIMPQAVVRAIIRAELKRAGL